MRLRKTTPNLLFISLVAVALALSGASSAHRLAHHRLHHSANPKLPPPPPADSTKSAFAKLVVKNLGPVLNSKVNDFSPTLTADGLTMFYVSDRSGGVGKEDFWMTTRADASNDSSWSAPSDVTEINSSEADGAASIAADGQTIYFATNRNTTVANDVNIWVATLDGIHWKNVHEVGAPVNTVFWESQPSISPDNKRLFFASNRPGKIGSEAKENVDIFVSHQLPDGRWGDPINLGSKINTGRYDASPFLAADGTTLFFASDGHGGLGGLDIFKSEWKGPTDTDWTEPEALPAPINSPANDFFISFSAATNSLYFTSDRDGGSGKFDIWVALNPPAPKPTLVLKGRCYDVNTQDNLGAHVIIVDERTGDTVYNKPANSATGEYLAVLTADKDGKLGGPYIISATESNHFPYPATRDMIPLRDDTSRIWVHDIPMNNEKPPIVHWVTETPQLLKEKPSLYPNFKGVVIREQKTIELFTLLPMLFFDLGNGTLPSRYALYTNPDQTNGFSEDTISSTLNAYYNYLNIVGQRMRNNPKTVITLTGTNSQDVEQEMSIDLSRQRAEGVKKYLVEIWKIDPERIKVEARKLPENPTLPTTPEGIAENRRVELGSDAWEIVHPVLFNQVVKRPDAPTGGFQWENGLRDDAIAKRDLVISYQGKPWADISDLGPLSTTSYSGFNWRSAEGNKLPDGEDKMSVQLKVTDKTGREVLSNQDNIDVKQFSISQVVAEHLGDKTRETYNLILFTYNKSDMGKWNHKILDSYVYGRIQPNSDVTVNGFTDILGTDDYNVKLSTNRANAVKNDVSGHIKGRVKSLTAHGFGKSGPNGPAMYPNELPEGRYYNRTVQVLVETPINPAP
ncbi:MAG: OmpA family protein [Bacteroidota bacterium]|nr:OmpA family protein [Bacteroidota bacterium]MDP4233904.1 OmpA family protein [Bacteroidota bacterium]MDP4242846.1 OmpA family protein [Bacteroidota bacterium]MDP4288324.1 OmpA family protein [Bacteroidota bacterium]